MTKQLSHPYPQHWTGQSMVEFERDEWVGKHSETDDFHLGRVGARITVFGRAGRRPGIINWRNAGRENSEMCYNGLDMASWYTAGNGTAACASEESIMKIYPHRNIPDLGDRTFISATFAVETYYSLYGSERRRYIWLCVVPGSRDLSLGHLRNPHWQNQAQRFGQLSLVYDTLATIRRI